MLPCSATPFAAVISTLADRCLFSRVRILPDDNTGQYYGSKFPGECQHNNEGGANNGSPTQSANLRLRFILANTVMMLSLRAKDQG